MDSWLQNLTKMPFFSKDYYKVDLTRLSEYEELVPEWYNITEDLSLLKHHGFSDIIEHRDLIDRIQ